MTRTETFDSSARYTLEPGKVQLLGGVAELIEPETSGYLEFLEPYEMDSLTSVAETVTEPASCDVAYQLRIDGTLYYWSGAAWVESDGTFAQANTVGTINAQKATLPLAAAGSKVFIRAVLSGTTTATPELSAFTTVYNRDAVEPTTLISCIVHISLKDLLGAAFENETSNGKFWVKSESPISHSGQIVLGEAQESTFTDGFAELTIPETETPNKKVRFYVSYDMDGSTKTIAFHPCVIPNWGSANLLDITDPVSDVV